jgi:hypothetical protein
MHESNYEKGYIILFVYHYQFYHYYSVFCCPGELGSLTLLRVAVDLSTADLEEESEGVCKVAVQTAEKLQQGWGQSRRKPGASLHLL